MTTGISKTLDEQVSCVMRETPSYQLPIGNIRNGMIIPNHTNIVPSEHMSGDDVLDIAVVAVIMTAAGLYPRRMLEDIADIIRYKHPNYPKRVAEMCKKISEEGAGILWMVNY